MYLMECADLNKDGLLDYLEFTERFHQPAKSIGFHLCVLVVHLGDLLPSDSRLTAFKQVGGASYSQTCDKPCFQLLKMLKSNLSYVRSFKPSTHTHTRTA